MPNYPYQCTNCGYQEDIVVPIDNRDDSRIHSCGYPMKRLLSIPKLVLMKGSGRSMALDMLNSSETKHMTSEAKQAAFEGTKPPDRTVF